jgi:uncharacterized protein YfiM (DUF2279 family)
MAGLGVTPNSNNRIEFNKPLQGPSGGNVTNVRPVIIPANQGSATASFYDNLLITGSTDLKTGDVSVFSAQNEAGTTVGLNQGNLADNSAINGMVFSNAFNTSDEAKAAISNPNSEASKAYFNSLKVVALDVKTADGGTQRVFAAVEADGDILATPHDGNLIDNKDVGLVVRPDGKTVTGFDDQTNKFTVAALQEAAKAKGLNGKILNEGDVVRPEDDNDPTRVVGDQTIQGPNFGGDGVDVGGEIQVTAQEHVEHVEHKVHTTHFKLPPQVKEYAERNDIPFTVVTQSMIPYEHKESKVKSVPNMFPTAPMHTEVPLKYGDTSAPTLPKLPGVPVPKGEDVPPPTVSGDPKYTH